MRLSEVSSLADTTGILGHALHKQATLKTNRKGLAMQRETMWREIDT